MTVFDALENEVKWNWKATFFITFVALLFMVGFAVWQNQKITKQADLIELADGTITMLNRQVSTINDPTFKEGPFAGIPPKGLKDGDIYLYQTYANIYGLVTCVLSVDMDKNDGSYDPCVWLWGPMNSVDLDEMYDRDIRWGPRVYRRKD